MSFTGGIKKTLKQLLLSGRKRKPTAFWRTFFFAFPGSLTVETAAVLPIFMFAITSLLYISEVIRCSDLVLERLHQNARQMAVSAYVADKAALKDDTGILSTIGGVALSRTVISSDVNNTLQESSAKAESISYLRSKYLENGMIDLVAVEEYVLPYDFMGIGSFKVMDRARIHAFTGYDPGEKPPEMEECEEEVVYITPTGSVYHRNRNCSHLKITVRQVAVTKIDSERSSSGGKYYPCEYCSSKRSRGNCYVTDYGDRYHTRADCQGLKRDVMAVPISKAGGRSPCKSCGMQ